MPPRAGLGADAFAAEVLTHMSESAATAGDGSFTTASFGARPGSAAARGQRYYSAARHEQRGRHQEDDAMSPHAADAVSRCRGSAPVSHAGGCQCPCCKPFIWMSGWNRLVLSGQW